MSGASTGSAADETVVRPATPADAEGAAELERRWLGADAWSGTLVAEAVGGHLPTVQVLVADRAGAVVGYAVLSVVDETADLQRLAVEREHRRTGVATALVDAAADLAAGGGARRLLVEVRVDNAAARALYADRGFGDLGRRKGYYRDGAAALVLQRALAEDRP